MSERPSQAEIDEALASHAQEVELQNASGIVEWMKREMPEGTIIGNPEWWAMKIYRRFVAAEKAAREKAEAKLAEYQAAILRYENVCQDELLKPEEELAALLSAEREAGRNEAVPDGWQVVPIEPTPEMTDHLTGPSGYTSIPLADAWREMLAAALTPAKEE